jgi:transposase InsO family protein
MMCKMLDVSRSGYYAWVNREPSEHARTDDQLASKIRAIHREHRERYGSPRIRAELAANGTHVGQKRVARIMQKMA